MEKSLSFPECLKDQTFTQITKVTHTINSQQVYDLLVTGFEGGANYWYDDLEPLKKTSTRELHCDRFYEDLLTHGFSLVDKNTGEKHEVKTDDLVLALDRMMRLHPNHFYDILNENTDADTGDVFLQLAVFNEVIYG